MNDFDPGYTMRASSWVLAKKIGIFALLFGLIYQVFGIYEAAIAVSFFYWLAFCVFLFALVIVKTSQRRSGVHRPIVDLCVNSIRQRGVFSLNQLIFKGAFTGLLLVVLVSQGFVITALIGMLMSVFNSILHLLASVPEI